ncbi:MAG: hypothetical protein M0C28_10830 [Candidatus Moduliflexus flocculans]|nr:hypothetical protein [Candidatus Moduliflexus flocculans]
MKPSGTGKKMLLNSTVAAKVNGVPVDLSFILKEDSTVEPIDISSREGLVHIAPQHISCHGAGRAGCI